MKNQTTCRILFFFCLLVMLICITAISAQTRRSTKPQSKESEQIKKADAAWTPFYAKFRQAISSRSHKTLRAMMSEDFKGGYDEDNDGDDRDDPIQSWVSSRDRRAVLAGKPSRYWRNDDNILTRTVGWQVGDPCCTITFEFRDDEKWYITEFYCGCTA